MILNPDSFYRVSQIVRDKTRDNTPIIPVSNSTWWAGVKAGIYPPPVKLSAKVTVWRGRDLLDLINNPGKHWG